MSRVLVIDNYDSFTYNLVQAFRILGAEVTVRTNDRVTPDEARAFDPSHLVVSPGPGRPEKAGISMSLIGHLAGQVPILGICLGHQAIGSVFGGTIRGAASLYHGRASRILHDGRTIFQGITNPFSAGRYHSLAIEEASLSNELEVSARTADGEVMGVRHRHLPVEGVQFHPESILTPNGDRLLENFLDLAPARSLEVVA